MQRQGCSLVGQDIVSVRCNVLAAAASLTRLVWQAAYQSILPGGGGVDLEVRGDVCHVLIAV
jgi:hypothetical protein